MPEIGPDDVLIRIHKTGICGTDMHIWNWDDWAARTVPVPLVIGHEFAGEIVEHRAATSTTCAIGQRCSGEGHLIGQHSRQSRAGKFHLDPETRGIGVNEPGAFAEYLRLPAFNVVPLPDAIDDEIGAILDPLGNAVHTALSLRPRGRGRADHRRRPDRHHGRRGGPACRRAARRHHRRQPGPAGAGRAGGRRGAGERGRGGPARRSSRG